ncbi:MAG: ATPase domain-containing protein [Candidatus Micrarchaeia archaeon]|jgi:circadian clock protein KaiC
MAKKTDAAGPTKLGRVPTGIDGLDPIIEGGLPRGSTTLVTGSAGTGKTIFGLQYLVEGARRGEKGVYINFDEEKEQLYNQALQFGWDLEKLESEGRIRIINFDLTKTHVINVMVELESTLKQFGPSRLVLDSISILSIYSQISAGAELTEMMGVRGGDSGSARMSMDEIVSRGSIMSIIKKIRALGATALIISELPEETAWLSRDTVSEFVCDGVILLHYLGLGKGESRTLAVRKMRGTKHGSDAYPADITSKGFVVKKSGDAFKIK